MSQLFPAPPMPAFAPGHATTTQEHVRYEDILQDGRLAPISLPSFMSGLWRGALTDHAGAKASLAQGIVPILTRITLTSHDQPIRVDHEVEARAGFQLAHSRDEAGEVNRLFMLIWNDVHGASGRIGGITQRAPGPLALAGSLFAEHTFTKLFAPPDQRRVTRLGFPGYPDVPELAYAMPAPATAGEAPDGATWIDELATDPAETVFSLDQTDSNQHVNSLVYMRVFLEAVWRRLAGLGRGTKLRSRAIDIAYRKPCFAGDRVRSSLRVFEGPPGLGAAGMIAGDDGKPRCYVRVWVGP